MEALEVYIWAINLEHEPTRRKSAALVNGAKQVRRPSFSSLSRFYSESLRRIDDRQGSSR
jgi:hypothetical protein